MARGIAIETARKLGVTRRQFDYWSIKGWIFDDPAAAVPGSGYTRTFTGREARRFKHMARLVHAGVKPDRAAVLARELAETGVTKLGPFELRVA